MGFLPQSHREMEDAQRVRRRVRILGQCRRGCCRGGSR